MRCRRANWIGSELCGGSRQMARKERLTWIPTQMTCSGPHEKTFSSDAVHAAIHREYHFSPCTSPMLLIKNLSSRIETAQCW